jgi:ketosteroid isomerase-like protein
MTPEQALHTAQDWVEAWNAHDLERIIAHYADPLMFTSPLVVQRLGRPDGTIRSRSELRDYFAMGLGPDSALRFELLEVLLGVDSMALRYRNHRGLTVIEVMRINDAGLADRVTVHYSTRP